MIESQNMRATLPELVFNDGFDFSIRSHYQINFIQCLYQ